jgi:hypothetical protein
MELELRPLDMKVDFFYPRQNKWNRLWIVFPRTLLENKNYIFLRKYKFDWTQKSYDDSKVKLRDADDGHKVMIILPSGGSRGGGGDVRLP